VMRDEYRPDYAITSAIATRAGVEAETLPLRIFNRMASKIPAFKGLSYKLLAQVTDQWPIVGREDLFYGGTLYANGQGLGMHLATPSQVPSLVWPDVPEVSRSDTALLAVPITVLYDHGQMIYHSMLLHQRTPDANITLHPVDAQTLNLAQGSQVKFTLDGIAHQVVLHCSEMVPRGIVLVPRSLGLPISSPALVEITAI